jgi:hypothetical protein
VNLDDMFRHVALYIDKILKGTKPADLPVEQPTKFELVVTSRPPRPSGSRSHHPSCSGRIR